MPEHPMHLPQLRVPAAVYFVAWRLNHWNDKLSSAERSIVADALKYFNGQRYRLAGFVVMDDHVHVMVFPLPPSELAQILHSWKSYTSNQINKLRSVTGPRWMKNNRTEVMRSEREIRAKLQYIVENPIRRWPDATDYRWVEIFDVL